MPTKVGPIGLGRGAEPARELALLFSEETVTETFLLDLKLQYPGTVTIVPFNKRKEAKTGADWAWCFENEDRSYSYPMMVQAKLLDDLDTTYREIDRTIGKSSTRQIDRTYESCETPWISCLLRVLQPPK